MAAVAWSLCQTEVDTHTQAQVRIPFGVEIGIIPLNKKGANALLNYRMTLWAVRRQSREGLMRPKACENMKPQG